MSAWRRRRSRRNNDSRRHYQARQASHGASLRRCRLARIYSLMYAFRSNLPALATLAASQYRHSPGGAYVASDTSRRIPLSPPPHVLSHVDSLVSRPVELNSLACSTSTLDRRLRTAPIRDSCSRIL